MPCGLSPKKGWRPDTSANLKDEQKDINGVENVFFVCHFIWGFIK
jgi:hypothetical protein